MHSYLKSIGFSEVKTEQELESVLEMVFRKYTQRHAVKKVNGTSFIEYSMSFGMDIGITLCGELDENGFHQEYYFPYFRGTGITTREDISVDKHGSRDSYAGACEDPRVGISLMFYVQNAAEYKRACANHKLLNQRTTTTLSGLADKGMILLPVCKSEEQLQCDKEATRKRNGLIAAARKGDEEAIESLTLEDMDTYSMISQRLQREDIFSIVDSFIMPFGMECDLYQVMGEILHVAKEENEYTHEKLYRMTISSNDIAFDICINQKDLMGEPEVGRRFKGMIWMQGHINLDCSEPSELS